MSDYDSEHHRIFKSVHHRLDLDPNMLLGAQQHTTVESVAALKIQDKIEGKYNENMQSDNGQYRNEMYKRAENMIPQLDGTFNVLDNGDSDSHSYLDLAGTNIILYRTRGQKQRHNENERANANRHSCYIVGLGLNCKFIDLLFKRSFIKFIEISFYLNFIVLEIICKQTGTLN